MGERDDERADALARQPQRDCNRQDAGHLDQAAAGVYRAGVWDRPATLLSEWRLWADLLQYAGYSDPRPDLSGLLRHCVAAARLPQLHPEHVRAGDQYPDPLCLRAWSDHTGSHRIAAQHRSELM